MGEMTVSLLDGNHRDAEDVFGWIRSVKEQLGHHSIQITVDIYKKCIQTIGDPAVSKLEASSGTHMAHPRKT